MHIPKAFQSPGSLSNGFTHTSFYEMCVSKLKAKCVVCDNGRKEPRNSFWAVG